MRIVLSTQKLKQAIAGIVTSPLFTKKTGTVANHAKATSSWNADEGHAARISHKNVLENLPSHIATLAANGHWQTVAPGNNEFLKAIEDEEESYDNIEEIWPDYPTEEDYLWNEDEY